MMKVCVQPRSGGRRAYSVRPEKRRGRFSLSPREERPGRELERGVTDEKRPPLPGPLLLSWGGEGEGSAAALQGNYLPNSIGLRPAVEPGICPADKRTAIAEESHRSHKHPRF